MNLENTLRGKTMKKSIKTFFWIILFPFMLTYWGWKKKKKPAMVIGAVLSVAAIAGVGWYITQVEEVSIGEYITDALESITESVDEPSVNVPNTDIFDEDLFEGYSLIEVDGGDLSGHREANVVVDIGFGDREYYGFTNEYGQLIKVVAKEIILQDDDNEPVLSTGRYYRDEAKVPGVESKTLDEGHVIADSLGGVSNAYNITPQNSTLNRHGDQAYMEDVIRDAGGCTDFVAIITYPNTTTHIPSHYSYTYTVNGNVVHDEYDNVDPDEANE